MTPLPFVTRSVTSAASGFAWSRFGPTVPLAPASASVWQPAQFVVKIDLPSVAGWPPPPPPPEPGFTGRPATAATYVATASASSPSTMFAGIPGSPDGGSTVGYAIWPRTTSRIVVSSKCWSTRTEWKASSRFGPITPFVPASARVWHEPQFSMNICFPAVALPGSSTRPSEPQPASASSPTDATSAMAERLRNLGGGLPGADRGGRLVARRIDREHPVEPGDLEDLRDVPIRADERELPLVGAEALHAADEHAERRRVDERRVR